MTTIAYDNDKPGQGAERPVRAQAGKRLKLVTGQFSFDSSYPVGGEDISDIFSQFVATLGIFFRNPTGSAGTGKICVVDYTNKKLKLFTNAAPPVEVADLSDQSGAAPLHFIAYGY